MKLENGHWVDSRNNRWEASKFTEFEAEMLSKTLEGSWNCTNCIRCEACYDCINCHDCRQCGDCRDCSNCIQCDSCSDSVSCWDCTECTNCDECTDCHTCTDCYKCKACTSCTRCGICEGLYLQNGAEYTFAKDTDPARQLLKEAIEHMKDVPGWVERAKAIVGK